MVFVLHFFFFAMQSAWPQRRAGCVRNQRRRHPRARWHEWPHPRRAHARSCVKARAAYHLRPRLRRQQWRDCIISKCWSRICASRSNFQKSSTQWVSYILGLWHVLLLLLGAGMCSYILGLWHVSFRIVNILHTRALACVLYTVSFV